MSVTFASKCWKNDYIKLIYGGFKRKEEAIGYPFEKSIHIYNNGVPGYLANGYHVADMDVKVLHSFGLKKKKLLGLGKGYIYAVGELSALYLCDTEYLCYVQGDCITQGGDWVTPGIKILEEEPDTMVVSPLSEVNTWHDENGYDHYMSDQAWLVRVKDFKDPLVYSIRGIDDDYPEYGGDSFEHKVGKYLKWSGKKRKILEEFYTQHPGY